MIKQLFKIFMILTIVLYACSDLKQDEFRISGTIMGMDNLTGTIAIPCDTAKRGLLYEEINFTDGYFEYKGPIKDPEVIRMFINKDEVKKMTDNGYIPVKSSNLWFVAMPGGDINVEGMVKDYVDAYPGGEKENKILAILFKNINPVINEAGNLQLELIVNKNLTNEERTKIESKLEGLNEKEFQLKVDFIEEYKSSIAGLWIIEDMVIRHEIEMEKVEDWLQNVDQKYMEVTYFKSLKRRIKGYNESKVGQIAPPIKTNNTPNGNEFNLASLEGKYVLLDFWGTWCGSCIAGIPSMKDFYNKHKDNLEIVGLAKDRDAEVWKEFIQNREMDWKHVLIGEGEENFVEKYNVAGYPTKILLSPDGKILDRTVGEDENYYREIEKLINY